MDSSAIILMGGRKSRKIRVKMGFLSTGYPRLILTLFFLAFWDFSTKSGRPLRGRPDFVSFLDTYLFL